MLKLYTDNMNRRLQVTKYVILDWLSAAIAWSLFYVYRKYSEDSTLFSHIETIYEDEKLWLGLLIVPLFLDYSLCSCRFLQKNI